MISSLEMVSLINRSHDLNLLARASVFIVERTKDIIMVKLGDFGIAKFETDGTDTYVGSRDYFAPVCDRVGE